MEVKKLKIGLFIDTFFPMVDGAVVVVDNYAKKLMEYGDVTVFCPKAREKTYIDQTPYKVVRSKMMRVPFTDYDYSTPSLDYKFQKELRKSNLDVVHIHSPFAIGKTGVDYAMKHRIPCMATLHSQFRKDFEQRIKSKTLINFIIKKLMKVFNRCDELYTVNNQTANVFVTYGVQHLPKVRFNGTDLLPLPFDETITKMREEYCIDKDCKVFLFVGRIDIIKNIFFIIDALRTVKENGLPFHMFFIGSGPDEERLKKYIEELNLTKEITMVGRIIDRTQLARFYQLADLFIFPSLYDTNSLVQIEAASQKTATLFLKNAVTTDTVTDGVNGFLADHDPILYGQSIISICQNEKLLNEVSENAFRDLYLTWDEQILKTVDTYRQLIDHKKTNHVVIKHPYKQTSI